MKIAVVDIHKLLSATPFGEAYKNNLADQYLKYGAIHDLNDAINTFQETYKNELINAYKEIDPELDLVIIVRTAVLDMEQTSIQNKVIYKSGVRFFPVLTGGYFSEQADITDEVSVKFPALLG